MSDLIYGSEEDLKEFELAEAGTLNDYFVPEEELNMYLPTLSGLEVGKVVTGTIKEVADKDVIVDISFKSEGIIPRDEFIKGQEIVVGSDVEVYIDSLDDTNGYLVLSKSKADFARVWTKVNEAYEKNEIVKGLLTRRIKGGVVVDLYGVEAFLPGSQIDLRQIPDINALIGQEFDLKVLKINEVRRNIVVSRRVVLEEERTRIRGDVLGNLEKGQVRVGIVKNITDFGAFIDLGGVDGLLHITDMSYRRISHPSELCQLGEEIEVKVLDFNDKKERISLGLKQLQAHPWKGAEEKFPEAARIKGKIVSITNYGAFVELGDGIEGLIHVSEMSWTEHVKHPSQVLNVNDEVEAVVLKVDIESEKISLGLKQLEEDPWLNIESELPPGAKVTGEIRNIASFGAFVEIKEGVDGLIHVSDMSWTKKIAHPSEMLNKGDKVECVVLAVDRDKRRISLSMKHLEEDPWDTIEEKFKNGDEVKGKIVRMLDRGVVVELENGVEGFIPTNKLTKDNIKVPSEAFKLE
ncbi:MAG: 30S ribosomal protein S1, partial [Fibrobacterales bacterium]